MHGGQVGAELGHQGGVRPLEDQHRAIEELQQVPVRGGRGGLADFGEGLGEREVGLGEIWIDLEGRLELLDRRRQLARLRVGDAGVEPHAVLVAGLFRRGV